MMNNETQVINAMRKNAVIGIYLRDMISRYIGDLRAEVLTRQCITPYAARKHMMKSGCSYECLTKAIQATMRTKAS